MTYQKPSVSKKRNLNHINDLLDDLRNNSLENCPNSKLEEYKKALEKKLSISNLDTEIHNEISGYLFTIETIFEDREN